MVMQNWIILVENPAMVEKYLGGDCDALAIAIAQYCSGDIETLHALHHLKDGGTRRDPDFIHAYAVTGRGPVDAKGYRSREEIENDFEHWLDVVKRPEDKTVIFEMVQQGSADEFIQDCGVNGSASRIRSAEKAAIRLGLV